MILNGIKGILKSKKGTFSLLVLSCATTGLLLGKLDGVSFAAVIGTIATIFMWTTNTMDLQSLKQGNSDVK